MTSGESVTIDTVSHEGILEDQGRHPVSYFEKFGVPSSGVLRDAIDIADSQIPRDFDMDGPHVITGPIAVEGAQVGDLLAVEVLDLQLRTGYGLVSSRHGKGALPDDFPLGAGPDCVFCTVEAESGAYFGRIEIPNTAGERALRFPLRPFLGVMGVGAAGSSRPNSVPPGPYGGNIDIRLLGVGATLYLPVQAPDALFYVGDPHFAQGDGEVALTAFEAPLRATVRVSIVDRATVLVPRLHAMTDDLLIPIGLHEDLDEAMRECVRCALDLLERHYGVPRATAYAYLSAAGDFAVSQVVDRVKGVHGLIRKADLPR
jgi:acetamidase/formamidase